MRLYILRHATAEEAAASGDDGARKLTERSKEKMRSAAAGLRAMGLKFNAILTSPLVRATETAERRPRFSPHSRPASRPPRQSPRCEHSRNTRT
jgi:phosphohistidine phosphatase SixA